MTNMAEKTKQTAGAAVNKMKEGMDHMKEQASQKKQEHQQQSNEAQCDKQMNKMKQGTHDTMANAHEKVQHMNE